ncbi:hypothetical protein [Anatilimnocola floriformis]|nr:hypothetical protein [Anatilimnocola floriformis]
MNEWATRKIIGVSATATGSADRRRLHLRHAVELMFAQAARRWHATSVGL